jgi:oxygen-independent coproporphyrinogen-3 oxidase
MQSEPVTGSYFVSAYPPFDCWDEKNAGRFRAMLGRPAPQAPLGLYLHIPFCVHRCSYCYYLARAGRMEQMDGYLESVSRELALYMETAALAGRELSFVYFGGGTPSLLSEARLSRLFDGLQATAPWDSVREATFECAPRSVTQSKLQLLRDAGITRLSLGVQQLDDDVLRESGRVHLVRDVERAYELVRATGFDVVNIDLIVGLVGESEASFERSLEQVIGLAPDSVTIYQLEIPRNTPLYRSLRDDDEPPAVASWEVKRQRLAAGFARLEEEGYTVRSAYAAVREPDCRFVYQEDQYRGADLLGIGVSSFSYIAGIHQQNRTSMTAYTNSLAAGELPLGRAYVLSDDERLVREFVLQLKLGAVELGPLRERFDVDPVERFRDPLTRAEERGWLTIGDDRIAMTRAGLLRVDRLLPDFYLPEHGQSSSSLDGSRPASRNATRNR